MRDYPEGSQFHDLEAALAAGDKVQSLVLFAGSKKHELRALPDEVSRLSRLRNLELYKQPITDLPECLEELPLERLHLWRNNALLRLPSVVSRLRALDTLEILDCAKIDLGDAFKSLARLPTLTTLAVGRDGLVDLPVEIAKLHQLLHLEWHMRGSIDFESATRKLAKLPELRFFELLHIDKPVDLSGLGRLRALRGLKLHGKLTQIPDEIGQLTGLERLEIESSRITSLPASLARLVKLEELVLNANKLKTVPDLAPLVALRKLELRANQLTCVPPGVAGLPALTELDLRSNNIVRLPVELKRLPTLSVDDTIEGFEELVHRDGDEDDVTLYHDVATELADLGGDPREATILMPALRRLPDSIAKAGRLEQLTLRTPSLDVAHAFRLLKRVKTLRSIWAGQSGWSRLPDEIGLLRQLTHLGLDENGLEELPAAIGKLTRLRVLSLQGNPLGVIPPILGALKALETLELGPVRGSIPVELGRLKKLKELTIQDAQLSGPQPGLAGLRALEKLVIVESTVPLEELSRALAALPGQWRKARSHRRLVLVRADL